MDVIYFGAGCFWCVEAVFERLNGVSDVVSGYMGGHVKNPAYREVCNGTTGHAEVVKIEYLSEIISYEDLLRIFWTTHDPTTLNRQGADRGTQYRSAIFYTTEVQRIASLESKSNYATEMWQDPIVTEIKPAGDFYLAENYHQDYYTNNPDQGYCSKVIPPKIAKLRASFSQLINK